MAREMGRASNHRPEVADQPPNWGYQSEAGFTLPELLVGSIMMLIAAVGVMSLLLVGVRQADSQSSRITALDKARNGMMQMTAEMRSAAASTRSAPRSSTSSSTCRQTPRTRITGSATSASATRPTRTASAGPALVRTRPLHSGSDCSRRRDRGGMHRDPPHGSPSRPRQLRRALRELRRADERGKALLRQGQPHRSSSASSSRSPGAENPIELRSAITVRNCLTNQRW